MAPSLGARLWTWCRAAVSDNLGLKVISLLCALSIYAFIHGAERVQRTFSVGVVSVMPAEAANRQLRTPLPTEVGVTLRGPRTTLDGMSAADLGSLKVDLRTGHETKIELDPTTLSIPPAVKVEQLFPSQVVVRWDDVVNSNVRVQVTSTGEPGTGMLVQATLVDPLVVMVRGPKSVVDVMQSVRTVPFDVTGLGEGTHKRVLGLDLPPDGVIYDSGEVTAAVEITLEQRTVSFAGLTVEVIGLPKAVVKPATVRVKVRGPVDLVRGIERDSLVPRVEVPEADRSKPSSRLEKVIVDLPGVEVEIEPSEVLVKW